MKIVQGFAVVLASMGQIENLACVRTAASSAVLVSMNIWYICHLLRRPYASHRPSSKMVNPINDAEILTTRTVSLAAALLSFRDTLATSSATSESSADIFRSNSYIMDLFCVFVLIFIVRSNLRLFAGLEKDFKRSTTKMLKHMTTSLRYSSTSEMEVEVEGSRSRGHTGANESTYSQINTMLETESHREIIMLQKMLRIDEMPKTEKAALDVLRAKF